jgi:NADPH-dependent ferric siderophore reductase
MTPNAPIRVRHETRRRILTVKQISRITPKMIRINFSTDLADFASAAADDHVKLFFFPEDSASAGAEGSFERAVGRDFTPRRFNNERGELTIDFALHDEGVAAAWARQAEIGQRIGLGGPRSSFVVADGYDWHVLIGDEAALPAIGRRLEELPAGAKAFAFVAVNDPSEEQQFETSADLKTVWIHRPLEDGCNPSWLLGPVTKMKLPPGSGFIWVAAESATVRAIRQCVLETLGHPKEHLRAAAYWRGGDQAVHESY